MSYVAVYHVASPDTPNKVLTHLDDIASTLAEHGVRFERWQPSPVEKGAGEAQMIAAYQPQIDALGYPCVALCSVSGNPAQSPEWRAQCLEERRYHQDQAHFFIAGQALFTLRIGDYVYGVRCEKNDLLMIPAGLPHCFDMEENPHCVTLRLSHNLQEPVPDFTGDKSALGFPGLDD